MKNMSIFNKLFQFIFLIVGVSHQVMATESLVAKGYKVYPIETLSIIKLEGKVISSQTRKENKCDILLSGTFFGKQLLPVGPFFINDELKIDYPKTLSRGFVAIFNDGSVRLSSMSYTDYDYRNPTHRKEKFKRFKKHLNLLENTEKKQVIQLIGGGAHIIFPDSDNKGQVVSKEALLKKQFFDQGIGNLNSAQMRRTHHIVIITIENDSYGLISPKVTGKTLQSDLINSQVKSAVKFDGGSGCSAYKKGSTNNICPSQGENPSGFCINF